MAYIPVEKKSSPLLWIIPLALIAALVIGAIALLSDDDEINYDVEPATTAVVTDTETVAMVEEPAPSIGNATTGTITTVSGLLTGSSASVAGRDVKLDGLEVVEVVGDYGFYVTPVNSSTSKKIFVMLDEEPTPGSPIEGRYDVNVGDTIGLTGKAKVVSRQEILRTDDMITKRELAELSNDTIFLHADKLSDVTETASLD